MRPAGALPPRARAAVAATRAVNAASRRVGAGSGTVLGGWVGLAVEPHLLERLAAGRDVALVSGTNGKTTTTRLLVVAVAEGGRPVVTNATGSNMPQGHVAALAGGLPGAAAVLEADEGYVPALVAELHPAVVALLNLSRDQLDRTNEVRMVAGRWRQALGAAPATTVVANADDPLVVWGASAAARVVWVGAGLGWRMDAAGCPACEGRIDFAGARGWACTCGFARPALDVWMAHDADDGAGTTAVFADGRRVPVVLGIPGRFNEANAVVAAAAAEVLGVPAGRALALMARVDEVAGRFAVRDVHGVPTRLMLAKNPAGWAELLDLVCPGEGPVVVGINARVADGKDPSWLWDVAFERLRGRPVVATGERCRDLAVRLRYAEVPHRTVEDPARAVRMASELAAAGPAGPAGPAGADGAGAGVRVDFIGNYTAFHDLLAGS